jgi:hypothetical protein
MRNKYQNFSLEIILKVMLETAKILTNRIGEAIIIVALAENDGLQIKFRE